MIRWRRVRRSEFFAPMSAGWIFGTSLFAACILLVFFANRVGGTDYTVCPMRLTAGIPCPLCGGTTACFKLVAGDLAGALVTNPLVTLSVAAYAIWALLWVGFGVRFFTTLRTEKVAALLLLAFAANWAYVLTVRL